MHIEYACLDYSLTEIEVQSNIEYAIKNSITNIVLHPYSIGPIKNLHPNLNIACELDYPYGLSDIKSRNFMVEQACKTGVSTIDIVTPNKILTNRKYDKLREDIRSNLAICKEHSVSLRYILEYRVFSHEVLAKVCQILKTFDINTVLPSSGIFLDDINDNLIVCSFLNTKSKIDVISNGNIYTAKQIQSALTGPNTGLRLYYKNSIDLYTQYNNKNNQIL